MEILSELLQLSVGGVTVAAIIIFLGKFLISKGSDIILENHKNQLEISKNEHQIRFSSLHQERGEVLKKIYRDLYELEKKLEYVTTLAQGPNWSEERNREEEAITKYREAYDRLEENRIYLPEDICSQIFSTLKTYSEIVNQMLQAKNKTRYEKGDQPFRFPEGEGSLELWIDAEKRVQTDIKNARLELVNEFRELIGV